jgi:uncharacterized membrane protein HdeD (DUF308 family)
MSGISEPRPGFVSGEMRVAVMSAALARNWWAVVLRGVFAIIFGLIALALPGLTIASLVLLFAVYMLVDGVFAIISAVRAAAHHERWGFLILEGVLDILAGLAALLLPAVTVLFFVILLAVWAIISGISMTLAGFRLHGSHGRWLLVLSGLVSVIWGVLLFLWPIAGAVVLTWWLGAYALVFGVMLIVLGFRLRSRHIGSGTASGAAAA